MIAEPSLPPPPTWYSAQTSLMAALPSLAQASGAQTWDSWRERVGERTYGNAEERDVWMRYLHSDGRHAGGGLHDDGVGGHGVDPRFEQQQQMLQVGVDAYRRQDGERTSQVFGAFLAAGRSDATVWHRAVAVADAAAVAGTVNLDTTVLGLYWTSIGAGGGYLDLVAQYADHAARIQGAAGTERTKASGLGASLEVGRTFNDGGAWSWTPQAQLRWQQVDVDDIRLDSAEAHFGTYLFDTADSLVGRLGIAARYQRDPTLALWGRADVMHEFMADNTTHYHAGIAGAAQPRFVSDVSGTRYGLTLGLDARLGKAASLYASGGYEQGSGGSDSRSWNGRIGLRLDW